MQQILRGARLVDGTGAPAMAADVGIEDGRIEAVGGLTPDGAEVIDLDGLVLAVPHRHFRDAGIERLFSMIRPGGVFVDVKTAIDRRQVPAEISYWSL